MKLLVTLFLLTLYAGINIYIYFKWFFLNHKGLSDGKVVLTKK